MKQNLMTNLSWGVVLWLFRCFCIVWAVVVSALAARGFVLFVR